jgi:hypothetical protein
MPAEESIANIANPIYDGAFKYLLDDNRIARIFLSALIGSEIVDLEFRPTEHRQGLTGHNLTVFRMDFAATVRMADGSARKVLIEIQKAKLPDDILRFRRYLGHQYASPDNVLREEPARDPLEIFTIYFLGHKLEHTQEPVVWVRRELYGLNGDPQRRIEGVRERFIDALTHDSIVVQIPFLKRRRKTDLEKLLAIFDQSQTLPTDPRMLGMDVSELPPKYREVVRRLAKAAADVEVREQMDLEDTFLADLEESARAAAIKVEKALRELEDAQRKSEEAERQKEEAERQTEEAHRKTEEAHRKAKEAEREAEGQRQEKEEALAEIERLRKLLEERGR